MNKPEDWPGDWPWPLPPGQRYYRGDDGHLVRTMLHPMSDWRSLGLAEVRLEGAPTYWPITVPKRAAPFLELRRWVAIRLERLADLICKDRDTGW